jgi:alginate O-acetyltransferase complex protein AlgI
MKIDTPTATATPGDGGAVGVWWRTTGAKLALLAGGAALLVSVSRGPWAVVMLSLVTLATFGLAKALRGRARTRGHRLTGRLAVPLAFVALVAMNVFGFVGTLTGAQSSFDLGASAALIAMPFYLLGAAAFVADMAEHRAPMPRLLDYAVYMALPFKLLAGPLEPPRLIEQIRHFRFRLRPTHLLAAWPWLALGLFMKYVVANRLDPARNLVFVDPVTSFMTAAIFELKFYFDFAGYSFMAFGAAMALGLRITQNFDHPFLAPNVVLFWRSWHMSLGRFLSRYVLEPNLSLWRGRQQKLLFASGIFLVSAMWHGGTLNYLLWGLFHGAVYYGYVQWMKRREVPAAIGLLAMLLFFVLGRMFAIDADAARLLTRLGNFFDPSAWVWALGDARSIDPFLFPAEGRGVLIAGFFLAFEVLSRRLYPQRRGYHLMRRPWFAFALTVVFVLFGIDTGTLLYARI